MKIAFTLIALSFITLSCQTTPDTGLPPGVETPAGMQVSKKEAKEISALYDKKGYKVTSMIKFSPTKVAVYVVDKKYSFAKAKDTVEYISGKWVISN